VGRRSNAIVGRPQVEPPPGGRDQDFVKVSYSAIRAFVMYTRAIVADTCVATAT
jgi:hypothetical protein